MNNHLIDNLLVKCETLSSVMPHVVFKTTMEDIPLPSGVRDIYRVFILSQLTKDQRIKINAKLELFVKEPAVLLKAFIKSGDLTRIKKVYIDAFKRMEKTYAYQEIINACESIINLITDEKDDDTRFYYDILSEIGKAWYSLGFFKKSIDYYKKALEIAIERKWAESTPYGWIGAAYFYSGQHIDAINSLEQAINIARTYKEDIKLLGFWLGVHANAVRDSNLPGSIELSIALYDEPLLIAMNTNDRENESRWLANRGNAFRDLGDSKRAREEYYEKALKIAIEIGNNVLQCRWLNNIGLTFDEQDKRIEYFEKSLLISRECGDHHNENIVLGNLGNEYNLLGQSEKAINFYKEALEISMMTKNIGRAKGHIIGLLNSYKNADKLREITVYMNQKLDEAKAHEDEEDEIFWLAYLGYVFQNLVELKEARNYYNQAVELAKQLQNLEFISSLITSIDEVSLLEVESLYNEGKFENALQKCNDLIKKIMQRSLTEIIKSFNELYKIQYPFDNLPEEIQTYKKKIENSPSDSDLHMKLADCYARTGDLAEAILEYKKAIKLNPSSIITVLSMMEVTVWRRQYSEAIKIYQKWSGKIVDPNHKVIASWIVCTALALDGKSYENHIEQLLNMEIDLSDTGYSYTDILPYFTKMLEEGFQIDCFINAWELYNILTQHFLYYTMENIAKATPQKLVNEPNVILMTLYRGIVPAINPFLLKAYMKRGIIYRMLGNLNLAIKDYITATIYNPISDEAYMTWGACLAQKGELEKAIPKYAKSIELNPENKMAILGKMEIEICLDRYKDAITTYEGLKEVTLALNERVIASFLVCLSSALRGKPYKKNLDPLYCEVKLSEKQDWCNVEIDRYLESLEKSGYNPDRITQAKKIRDLFRKNFSE